MQTKTLEKGGARISDVGCDLGLGSLGVLVLANSSGPLILPQVRRMD